MMVEGDSGIGKSAFSNHFLDEMERRANIVALRGRCYEREFLPYKAVDALVDRLTQYLGRLPIDEAAALVPDEIPILTAVFPVLKRLRVVDRVRNRAPPLPDPQEKRRRAFQVLRELLRRIASRVTLVLFIDDLQWGDVDSAAALDELLAAPSPPVLLLVCFRTDEVETSPILRLVSGHGRFGGGTAVHRLKLAPLGRESCLALALAYLGEQRPGASKLAEVIAADAAGSPFFVEQMARDASLQEERPPLAGGFGLGHVLDRQIERLDGDAARLLQAVAIAGRPIDESVAALAAALSSSPRVALASLRAARLVSTRSSDHGALLEIYHDRIREALTARLSAAEKRLLHGQLARAYLALDPDPEALLHHYQSAGEASSAARFAVVAAERAASSLAFHHAAALYRVALELGAGTDGGRLHAGLAEALAGAGLGAESATHFATAAKELESERADDSSVLDWKRRAAEQYLRSGCVEEGLGLLREVTLRVGVPFPESPKQALASLVWQRVALRLRALGGSASDGLTAMSEPPDPVEQARVETCWSAALGLSMVDSIRSADFQARHMRLALRLHDPVQVARALATQSVYLASEGGVSSKRRCDALLVRAGALATSLGDPGVQAIVDLCTGVSAYFRNEWRSALEACGRAEQLFRERCTGVAWERITSQIYALWSLVYLGETAELARRLPPLLQEARQRDDVFGDTSLRLGLPNLVWLVADRPDEAMDQIGSAMSRWPRSTFQSQHYFELVAAAQAELYGGKAGAAFERIQSGWPKLRAAFLLRLPSIRAELLDLRARCALAADDGTKGSALRSLARADARAIARERIPASTAFAETIRAQLAFLEGGRVEAIALFERASLAAERIGLGLHAASARLQKARLEGGDPAPAESWMRAQGVVNPARMARLFVPVSSLP
jgi:hypothetical protein